MRTFISFGLFVSISASLIANRDIGLPNLKSSLGDPIAKSRFKKYVNLKSPLSKLRSWDDYQPYDDEPAGIWTFGGNSTINTSQAQFSNWQGGGQNSVAISTTLSLNLIYASDRLNWESGFSAGYGIMLQGKDGQWFKNDDRLEITSKFGLKANNDWFYAGLLSLNSQFQPGYYDISDKRPISQFLAPGYLMGSLGFDYNPGPKMSLFIGPLTSKNTIVLNQDLANEGAYGVQAGEYDFVTGTYTTLGKRWRQEAGGSVRLEYNEPRIVKNVGLQSRVILFSNYLYKPGNIDVDFENTFLLKVNEYISTTLILHFIYDDDIQIALEATGQRRGPRLQFKEVLAVGLNIDIGGSH
jgi:hypothetical protein